MFCWLQLITRDDNGSPGDAVRVAEELVTREKVVLLMGKDGGKMKGLADAEIIVPHFGYADRIQEIHIKVIHILIGLIEKGMAYA